MHDIGDMLLQADFSDPVVDMEQVTIYFSSIKQMLKDLHHMGSVNLNAKKTKGLQSTQLLDQLAEHYPKRDNQYPVTVEIIYGLAWGKTISNTASMQDGEVSIPLNRFFKQ